MWHFALAVLDAHTFRSELGHDGVELFPEKDLYAMGADGLMSLSFQGVPTEVPAEVATEIARGGASLAKMSGAPVVGGHSVESKDLLFGLAAVGLAHPERSDS